MADLLRTSRLSQIDLRGVGATLASAMADVAAEQRRYEARATQIGGVQRDLEAERLRLEDQLAQNAQKMNQAADELDLAERGMADCADRIRELQDIEAETNAIKQQALADLQATMSRIPAKASYLLTELDDTMMR